MEPDPDEDEIEDVVLDDKRERHCRMVFEENNGGVDGAKTFYMIGSGMSTIQRRRHW